MNDDDYKDIVVTVGSPNKKTPKKINNEVLDKLYNNIFGDKWNIEKLINFFNIEKNKCKQCNINSYLVFGDKCIKCNNFWVATSYIKIDIS